MTFKWLVALRHVCRKSVKPTAVPKGAGKINTCNQCKYNFPQDIIANGTSELFDLLDREKTKSTSVPTRYT